MQHRLHLGIGVSITVMVLILAGASSLAVYCPESGKWLSRDPVGEIGGINLTQAFLNDPANHVDPLGLLNRQQLDWLAKKWVPNWQGVDSSTRADIANALPTIRAELRKLSPNGFRGSTWPAHGDDSALQNLVDAGTPALQGFPGKAFNRCWDCDKIKQWIDDARKIHDSPTLTDAFILAWIMKESSWDTAASAYGRTGGKSTATGLSQILRSTWQLPAIQQGLPSRLQGGWESVTTLPILSLAAGMWTLDKHPGATTDDRLASYKGKNGQQYVQRIRAGEQFAAQFLQGRSLDQLSQSDCDKLMSQLNAMVHK